MRAVDPQTGRLRRRAIWSGVLALVLIATGAGWLGLREADRRRWDQAIDEAKQVLESGRPATAQRLLESHPERIRERGDYWLLLCRSHLELGHPDRAKEALSRISPGTPESGQARVFLARDSVKEGRLSDVEKLLDDALLSDPGEHALEACHLLATCLKFQGRRDEALRLYRDRFDRIDRPVEMLRELWSLRHEVFPAERVGPLLQRANQSAPEDDRVWLGLANIATLAGRLDEAESRLAQCLDTRPNDPAVWRIRLDWALMKADPIAAREAVDRLDPDMFDPAKVLELASWFAGQRGDDDRRRSAIEQALQFDPGRAGLLDQLAFLENQAGRSDRAAELRDQKAEWERNFLRYEQLLFSDRPEAKAAELAELAGSLGWPFEQQCWERLAGSREDRAILVSGDGARRGPTLEDLRRELEAAGVGNDDRRSEAIASELLVPNFRNVARGVGLEFSYDPGRIDPDRSLPEMMGGGVALLDVDGDGWLDVFVVQGGPFPPPDPAPNADRLFRNRGDGTFEDISESAGLPELAGGYGFGVIAGDYDGDGWTDLFITRWRSYQLLRNRGDGTFEDVTEAVGLGGPRGWPSSAAFADLDGDGDLDLYVCHYLEFDPEANLTDPSEVVLADSYNPRRFDAETDRLFRNDGGRFVDITEESGIAESDTDGRGLGVIACDLDGDGRLDLYVANDMTENFLFLNRGDLRFEEVGARAGVAASGEGRYQASMGVACGDLDGDGLPELATTNYFGEGTALYRNLGDGMFVEVSAVAGLLAPSRFLLGFGAAFLDANNDGNLDLATANGHVNDFRPGTPFGMPTQLLLGLGDGRLIDVTEEAGPDLSIPRVGRALAVGDLDNNGRIDMIVVSQDRPLAFLHNESESAGGSLTLLLEATETARSAEGARVRVEAGGSTRYVWKIGGGSYQSSSDPRVHVGLGDAKLADRIEIEWPSGNRSTFESLPSGSAWRVREGDPEPRPLTGFDPEIMMMTRDGR